MWISYIPFGFLQQMYHDPQPEDWAHIEGNLFMTLTTTGGNNAVRCGGHIVYKEDVETIPESRSFIPDYGKLVQVDDDYHGRGSGNTYVYEEKPHGKNFKTMSRNISPRRIMDRELHLIGSVAPVDLEDVADAGFFIHVGVS